MISIVIPCYNAEKSLYKTVNSLLQQTSSEFEIVLINDGSTDGTASLCNKIATSDKRIRVIHQENRGLMGAWKRGVIESSGDFIAFCDADDYLDGEFIERVTDIIIDYNPEIIVYGVVIDYSDGKSVRSANRLNKGFYDEKKIRETILPNLLSDGNMQSELVFASRWSKVFNKRVLASVMDELNENVSIGEDLLTTFSTMQVARSLYCMGDYCPYHYYRHSDSMIGRFDNAIFDKIDLLFDEIHRVAKVYLYSYTDQLRYERLSVTLLNIKKYICRSTKGYARTIATVREVRESDEIIECIQHCSISKYSILSRIFAYLFVHRLYGLLYFTARITEQMRRRSL